MQVKEGKIFEDVSSGVSQLASKVGQAPPGAQVRLEVSLHVLGAWAESSKGLGCLRPCALLRPECALSSEEAQRDTLVPAPEKYGDSLAGGLSRPLTVASFSSALVLLPLSFPGECDLPDVLGDGRRLPPGGFGCSQPPLPSPPLSARGCLQGLRVHAVFLSS